MQSLARFSALVAHQSAVANTSGTAVQVMVGSTGLVGPCAAVAATAHLLARAGPDAVLLLTLLPCAACRRWHVQEAGGGLPPTATTSSTR